VSFKNPHVVARNIPLLREVSAKQIMAASKRDDSYAGQGDNYQIATGDYSR
jgi:hypothetical protein